VDSSIQKANFLTTAEVAAILKLNQQVLLRKLQSGEIPAYKIGKDWRIEEQELRGWLTSVSNRTAPGKGGDAEEAAIRRHFFDGNRLKTIPARRSKREVILRILAKRFEPDRTYREAEVNEILKSAHEDFCTLRRELVMARLLTRERGIYRRGTEAEVDSARAALEPKSADSARGAATAPRPRT
jgi:excisionase family DNA binding protein